MCFKAFSPYIAPNFVLYELHCPRIVTLFQVQSEFLWKIRDELYKNVANKDLKNLLTANNQDLPTGEAKVGVYELTASEK